MAKNKEKGDFMDLQEKFDNLSTGQKVLLYVVALVMLIISGIFLSDGAEVGVVLLLLDLIYFFIILFFILKYIKFNKATINTIINIMKKVFMLIIAIVFIIMMIAIITDTKI